ncbi:MAG: complex I NDUFA9 subunit family protein [Rhodospirillales bacterium]
MTKGRVTVFGGSGFLGRQIVKRLAADGVSVRVAVRRPARASFLEKLAPGGRIEVVAADVWDEASVTGALEGSAAAVNTVGHYVEKRGASFDAVHGEGARHVARQALKAGAERLVHISGIGADPASESPYVRARGVGEALVREAFEAATVLRPSVLFGPEDAFLNTLVRVARLAPALALFGRGETRLQPVFVDDVAETCARVLADPGTAGKTYELGGPRVYAYKELLELVLREVGRKRLLVPVPFALWEAAAAALSVLPRPPLSADMVTLMKRDNVVGAGALGLEDLGIHPVAVEEVLPACVGG